MPGKDSAIDLHHLIFPFFLSVLKDDCILLCFYLAFFLLLFLHNKAYRFYKYDQDRISLCMHLAVLELDL